jgi:hypothetical protein
MLILWLAMAFAPITPALAQSDVRVTASVRTNRVFMGDELAVEVLVEGADDVRPFDAPSVPGATMRFLGGSNISRSFTMIVNGQRTENSTKGYSLQYALSPTRPGRLVIPPIQVEVDGKMYQTEPITIVAIEPQTDTEFALELAIDEDRVYVGQPVRARVTWFIAAAVNEFSFLASPEPEGFDVYVSDTGQTRGRTIEFEFFGQRVTAVQSRATRGNESYPVLTFDVTLIPRETGVRTIGPLSVVFSRRDSMRVHRRQCLSNAAEIEVLPLPDEGRPDNFTGLVGVYTIDAQATPTNVAVGDPIELSVTIRGPEPMSRLDPPDLSLDRGFGENFKSSPDGWRRQPTTRAGERHFTTTIRARSDRVTQIPPIPLPYFDARTGEYRDATSEAIPLEVRSVREVTAADAITGPGRARPSLARELERSKPGLWALETDPDRLLAADGFDLVEIVRSPITISALAAPPALYAGIAITGFVRTRRDPRESRRRAALPRALRTVRSRGAEAGVRSLVADLLDRPAAGVTGQDCLDLAPDSADARLLAAVLTQAESARFGAVGTSPAPDPQKLRAAMRRVAARVRAEETS